MFSRFNSRAPLRWTLFGLLACGLVALAGGVAAAAPGASAPKLKLHKVPIPKMATVHGSSVAVYGAPYAVALSPDSQTMEFADYTTGVWAVNTAHPGRAPVALMADGETLAGDGPVGDAYSPNGHYLYVSLDSGKVWIFRVAAKPADDRYVGAVSDPDEDLDDPTSVAVSPDGKELYVASSGRSGIAVVALTDGGGAGTVTTLVPVSNIDEASSVAVSPNGKVLYVGGYSGVGVAVLKQIDGSFTDKGLMSGTQGPKADYLYGIDLSPDGRTLYLGYYSDSTGPGKVETVALRPNGLSGTQVGAQTLGAGTALWCLVVSARGARVYGLRYVHSASDPSTGATTVVQASIPDAVHTVRLSGKAHRGGRLTAKVKAVAGSALSYQWLADGKPIKHATHRSLALSGALVGKRVRVTVTGTVPAYSQVPKSSSAVSVKS